MNKIFLVLILAIFLAAAPQILKWLAYFVADGIYTARRKHLTMVKRLSET